MEMWQQSKCCKCAPFPFFLCKCINGINMAVLGRKSVGLQGIKKNKKTKEIKKHTGGSVYRELRSASIYTRATEEMLHCCYQVSVAGKSACSSMLMTDLISFCAVRGRGFTHTHTRSRRETF